MSKKTDTKRSLISAVQSLLKEKSDITVKEISDRAFANIAAINYYFGSKEALVAIAVSEIIDGFKQEFMREFDREFDSYEGCLEQLLNFLMDFYGEYKGVVRYIMMTVNDEGEKFMRQFFLDSDFIGTFLSRISKATGEKNYDILYYKYLIALSSFLVPLLIECNSEPAPAAKSRLALSSLQRPENRAAFIGQVMKIFL